MLRARHRPAMLIASLVLLLWAAPARAAEPPPDVVFDGTVTVTFSDPSAGGALPGADVTLVALRPDLIADPVVQELTGQTDAAGEAIFTGVARPAEGAPPVTLQVEARLERVNSCGGMEDFSGSASAPAALEVTIAVGVDNATTSCLVIPVRGTVLDDDGAPFPVASAVATVTYPDGGIESPDVTVGADGAFEFTVRGWRGPMSVELTVTGDTTTVQDPESGCRQQVALIATGAWDIASPSETPSAALVAELVVLSEACGSNGTPAPPVAPRVTLPPTDTGPTETRTGPSSSGIVMVLVIVLAAAVAALAAASIQASRRRG